MLISVLKFIILIVILVSKKMILFIGDNVFVGGAATTPIEILRSMADHGKQKQLKDIKVCSIHTEFESPYSDPDCEGKTICCNMLIVI